MIKSTGAFEQPIAEGKVRIQVNIRNILCSIENLAPDFLNIWDDHPKLIVQTGALSLADTIKSQELAVEVPENAKPGEELSLIVKENQIWFDVDNELAGDIWSSTCVFRLKSEYERYLQYNIAQISYELKWLQHDLKDNVIRSISLTRKVFHPAPEEMEETFRLEEVIKVSDMLGRAIKKIDLRTGSAYVRFNDDNGRLEPLIIEMGKKLGYQIGRIDKSTREKMEIRGDRVSHIISLIRGY